MGKTDRILPPKALMASARFLDALVLATGADRDVLAPMVQRFALTIAGKAPRVDSGPLIGLKPVVEEYRQLFLGLYRDEPNLGPSEYATFSALIRKHGVQAVFDRMRRCATWDDPFWKKQGFSVRVLAQQWDRLTALAAQGARQERVHECQHEPRCRTATEHSQKYLREMTSVP